VRFNVRIRGDVPVQRSSFKEEKALEKHGLIIG